MTNRYEHPNPVNYKHRLRTFLLGKEVSLMSEKTNSSRLEENSACLASGSFTKNPCSMSKTAGLSNADLAIELCLTTMVLLKDIDFNLPIHDDDGI